LVACLIVVLVPGPTVTLILANSVRRSAKSPRPSLSAVIAVKTSTS